MKLVVKSYEENKTGMGHVLGAAYIGWSGKVMSVLRFVWQ